MAEIDVLKAQLVRREVNAPWGFRLQGGAEFDRPITIMSVSIVLTFYINRYGSNFRSVISKHILQSDTFNI